MGEGKRNCLAEQSEAGRSAEREKQLEEIVTALNRRLATAKKKDTSEMRKEEVNGQACRVEEDTTTEMLDVIPYRCLHKLCLSSVAVRDLKTWSVEHQDVVRRCTSNIQLMNIAMGVLEARKSDLNDAVALGENELLIRQAHANIESEARDREAAEVQVQRMNQTLREQEPLRKIEELSKRLVESDELLNEILVDKQNSLIHA